MVVHVWQRMRQITQENNDDKEEEVEEEEEEELRLSLVEQKGNKDKFLITLLKSLGTSTLSGPCILDRDGQVKYSLLYIKINFS